MGLAISRAARVKRGAILFQNVTIGLGIDPASRNVGAPLLERDVHVGAGSTLVGPITLGAGSKVTANCFLRSSVPPDSLVEAPSPTVSVRARPDSQAQRKAET
jgi:serine O-acetyltransferase